ncbi:MAG TPA: exo-alpha-sialidase [Candidatus Xenobia bacterium]|jgi:photosystem II stability/assembly factor-like uncharacterized protein
MENPVLRVFGGGTLPGAWNTSPVEEDQTMSEAVTLLIGTHKGAFLARSDAGRSRWRLDGPFLKGLPVEYVVADGRDGGALYAAQSNPVYGPKVYRSQDGGQTWNEVGAPRFHDGDRSVERIWVIQPAGADQPGRLYAGIDPANLFVSPDRGESWEEVTGLSQHPSRAQWVPGKGGMCLHTVLQDASQPQRMWVAISAAGVFYTEDGGSTWSVRSGGVRADFLPNKYPAVGQCVHKIAAHPQRPDVIFLQNHGGVYRTDDGGLSWRTIEAGLPAVFGFPVAVHPREPETVFLFPMVADVERYAPAGRPAVYRSRNGGSTWQALHNGLPDSAWFTVLRQAMATDTLDPAGIYFGTTTGQLYASPDGGDHWHLVSGTLPPINSVRASVGRV